MTSPAIPPVIAVTEVPLSPEAAFTLFATNLNTWWPREFSWAGEDLLEEIGFEPRQDGHVYELGPGGFRLDWGRVLAWDPPGRLSFSWAISPARVPVPDPNEASTVTVLFEGTEAATDITVTHDRWEQHGKSAREYRNAMAGAWTYILECFQEHAAAARKPSV